MSRMTTTPPQSPPGRPETSYQRRSPDVSTSANDMANVSPRAARAWGHSTSGRARPEPSSGINGSSVPNAARYARFVATVRPS